MEGCFRNSCAGDEVAYMQRHRAAVLRLPPPSSLQLDVDEVLKPRLQLLLDLGLTVVRGAAAAGQFSG